ncbi:hypothetical protein MRB53_010017 [Persea americana]|uniref:Uncharacterized protein n=1 Tax=Persea americana TaxID=3435 RepID=A0ACC2LR07_PERAE|nr:hypothetical protein MRB53_010017 [Persea americana]
MKPILSSTSEIETARSMQQDRSYSPRRTAFRIQNTHADKPLDVLYGELSRKIKESKQNQSSGSPRNSFSGQISTQQINSEIMMPILRCKNETTPLSFISRIKDKKLENIECPVRMPRGLDFDNVESTSDFGSLCEDRNPDYRYFSEILLASGLLDEDHDFRSVATQLHPSGHVINPNMFMVLEELEAGSTFKNLLQFKFNKEKLHRKLLFDTVNEILMRRLETEAGPWLQVNKLSGSTPIR